VTIDADCPSINVYYRVLLSRLLHPRAGAYGSDLQQISARVHFHIWRRLIHGTNQANCGSRNHSAAGSTHKKAGLIFTGTVVSVAPIRGELI
jgi:hypothetical protein